MTLTSNQFYCVKCQKKRNLVSNDICVKTLKNGQPALKSVCPSCDTNLTKFIKFSAFDVAVKKYGKC